MDVNRLEMDAVKKLYLRVTPCCCNSACPFHKLSSDLNCSKTPTPTECEVYIPEK